MIAGTIEIFDGEDTRRQAHLCSLSVAFKSGGAVLYRLIAFEVNGQIGSSG